MRLSQISVLSILLSYIVLYGPVAGAGMYKWVDDNGEVHYGDRVPPEYANKERRKINEQGRTLKVYDAARTPEEIAEAERLEAERLEKEKQDAEQAKKDHILMSTYSSEDDLLKTRDGKLASLEGLIQLTERRIESMHRRMTQLTEEAAEFERSGKPIPEGLTRQIENIRSQTADNESFIERKKLEQEEIARRFQVDIDRFRELEQKNNDNPG